MTCSTLPRVACVCVTYKRPHVLPHAIESFLRQDYANRRLVILDDAGQYPNGLAGDRWRVFSTPHRYPTLGEKRNAAALLAGDDADVLAVWDDDDVYLPWHLSAAVEALFGRGGNGDITTPSACWVYDDGRLRKRASGGLYHSGWCYTKEVFRRAAGYPPRRNDEDRGFASRVRRCGGTFVDPCEAAPPSLIYRWGIQVTHISAIPRWEYDRLGDDPVEPVESLAPHWDRDWVEAVRMAEAR